jgi:magnesium chelatase family protein
VEKILKTKKIISATFDGNEAKIVEVESSFTKALPAFTIVGLASNSIQESKERVKSALLNNDFSFPPMKLTINLSPSDLNKKGSHFDLPIALSILLKNSSINLDEYLVLGELGLDGKIKDTFTIFPLVLSLAGKYKKIITSKESAKKLSKIPEIEVYGFDNIKEFWGEIEFKKEQTSELNFDFLEIQNEKYYYQKNFQLNFKDVIGQKIAKRVALISSAGMHNFLLEGSPGVGKSMIMNRLRFILPPMSLKEILEVEKTNSLDNQEINFNPIRPFRSPHHNSTNSAIFGGGSKMSKVGEIALANNGILFFDEFPQFNKDVLENLRLPLQEGKVLISRVNSKIEYKTEILFAAAMNPCPCGQLLSKNSNCRCTETEITRYKNRLSDPLLDRIDLYYQMSEDDDKHTISSKELFEQVLIAFEKQIKRGYFNSKLPEGFDFNLSNDVENILQKAITNFNLSKRAEFKVLKVARTIADLDNKENIEKSHILEAISYRKR